MNSMNFFSKRAFLIFFFGTVHSLYDPSSRRFGDLRVESGRDVSPGQFSFVVRIELLLHLQKSEGIVQEYFHICTGSALTPTATLTAGHCYQEELQTHRIAKHVIRYGSTPGKPDDQLDKFSDVLKCLRPPAAWSDNNPLLSDDLAIFTTEPIQLKSYGTISSLDYPSLFGLHVTLTGYGVTSHSEHSDTKNLKLPLQVIDGMMIQCEEKYACAFPLLWVKSACGNPQGVLGPGDSGGPVVHSTGIIGVNAKSLFAAYKFHPDYARVPLPTQVYVMPLSPYMDWLERTLQQNTYS